VGGEGAAGTNQISAGGDDSTPVQVLVGIFVAGGLEDIGGWVATESSSHLFARVVEPCT
jgi:hypothetical protein